MAEPEILRKIVVKISSDKRNLRGTGFFVSEREILTCHHVLADENGRISEGQRYFIKNDDREFLSIEDLVDAYNEKFKFEYENPDQEVIYKRVIKKRL